MAALAPAYPLFVGGCVRDALMDRVSRDIDIAVTTPPEETLKLANAAGLKATPTGLDHGVVTIIADGAPFEIATLRRDVATDGRRAVVAFTDSVQDDAARRDFTMNALYADASGVVLDPLGDGLSDLRAQRIRFIGDARQRLREDFLRILRFFRFHAQFSITPWDEEGLNACMAERAGLEVISAERVGAEMKKLLAAPDPGPALKAMGVILTDILPGSFWKDELVKAEADWRLSPDPMRRLAALVATSYDRLRLSNAELARLDAINICRALSLDEAVYRHGADVAIDALAILGVPCADLSPRIELAKAATFPVKASDLMERGIAPGPDLGAALKSLEATWIAEDFAPTREALLSTLEKGV